MSIWVIIDTFKSDDVIRKTKNTILAFWWRPTAETSLWSQNDVSVIQTVTSHYNPIN